MRAQMADSRQQNEEALQVLEQQGLIRVVPPEEEVRGFQALVDDSMPELLDNAFSKMSAEMVQQHLATLRRGHQDP